MAIPTVRPADISNPLQLVLYACETWLHQLHARSVSAESPAASMEVLLSPLERDVSARRDLERGVDALRSLADGKDVSAEDRARIRLFIRRLDDHLVQIFPGVHLLSFYDSADVLAAAEQEWIDTRGFASAWAAGPSRSKYEVLDRGSKAARLAQEFGDEFMNKIGIQARPISPYDRPETTLRDYITRTCDELIAVASLPPSSGAAAAIRHLAVIGEIALEQIEKYMFGDGDVPGSALAWRLPRVLTRIGELNRNEDVAAKVWGPNRRNEVIRRARSLLRRLFHEETPNLNRMRSLLVEAFRYLTPDDRELADDLLARLRIGIIARRDRSSGADSRLTVFGEDGLISTREQAYSAYTIAITQPDRMQEVLQALDGSPSARGHFEGIDIPVAAGRSYAAAFIKYIDAERRRVQRPGTHLATKLAPRLDLFAEEVDPQWRAAAGDHPELVDEPARLVWEALRSGADGTPTGWTQARKHRNAVTANRMAVDKGLAAVAIHARQTTRSLVAQAVLSIDGTGRREAIEALRQAGLADVAAGLFDLIVRYLEEQRSQRIEKTAWHLDWLLEQAVFCLSYTGSTAGFDTLIAEAGLYLGPRTRQLDPALNAVTTDLPDLGPDDPARRWIRTTALLGLADLGDTLHDDESDLGEKRQRYLVAAVDERLQTLASEPTARKQLVGPQTQLYYVPKGGEQRSLTAILAMLRLSDPTSARLLHLLSGRYIDRDPAAEDRYTGASLDNGFLRSRSRPRLSAGSQVTPQGVRVYRSKLDEYEDWEMFARKRLVVARRWDLTTWQLAEWGCERIETRFRNPDEAHKSGVEFGVRIVLPQHAVREASMRMTRVPINPLTKGVMPVSDKQHKGL